MTTVISILHHSIPSVNPDKIAEEGNLGWHFRSAKALKNHSKVNSECLRPSGHRSWITKNVEGIKVTLTPTVRLPFTQLFWKWNELSPALASYIETLVRKGEVIPYIHEYRAFNSELILRRIKESQAILQHHGSCPPLYSLNKATTMRDMLKRVREIPAIRREAYLKKANGIIFVLNRFEEKYLEGLGVKAEIKLRTMGVDFNEIKPATEEEKTALRKKYGIPEDAVALCAYIGVFGEHFSTIKGAHYIDRIHEELVKRFGNKVRMIVTGASKLHTLKWRSRGIISYDFLPHKDFLNVIGAVDLCFLPATSADYFGGLNVAIMEALAAGVPVVSPTLIHFPAPA